MTQIRLRKGLRQASTGEYVWTANKHMERGFTSQAPRERKLEPWRWTAAYSPKWPKSKRWQHWVLTRRGSRGASRPLPGRTHNAAAALASSRHFLWKSDVRLPHHVWAFTPEKWELTFTQKPVRDCTQLYSTVAVKLVSNPAPNKEEWAGWALQPTCSSESQQEEKQTVKGQRSHTVHR